VVKHIGDLLLIFFNRRAFYMGFVDNVDQITSAPFSICFLCYCYHQVI